MEKFEFIIAQGENYPAAVTSVNENLRRLYYGVNCRVHSLVTVYEPRPGKIQGAMPQLWCYVTALVVFPGQETDEMPGMEQPPPGSSMKKV